MMGGIYVLIAAVVLCIVAFGCIVYIALRVEEKYSDKNKFHNLYKK
jgi:hypothetical protein